MRITICKTNESSNSGRAVVVYNGSADFEQDRHILLSDPIIIKSGFLYKIKMEQDVPAKHFTLVQLKAEVEIESGIIVKFHGSTNEDGVMEGLISELVFNQFPK